MIYSCNFGFSKLNFCDLYAEMVQGHHSLMFYTTKVQCISRYI